MVLKKKLDCFGVVLFVDMVYTLGESLKLVGRLMWLLGQILALSV